MKKFFAVIGNPPYQEEQINEFDAGKKNFAPPIYHSFLSEAYKVSDKVEMIHPARFLFNAGATPKEWNEKMLSDEHLSVLYYEEKSEKVFPSLSTPIKGGVVVTMHDMAKKYRAIEVFTPYNELNEVLAKVKNHESYRSISDIVYSRSTYRLTPELHIDFPEAASMLSKGHLYDMSSNIFKCIPQVFYDKSPDDDKEYVCILGIKDNRVYKYIDRKYVKKVDNLDKYKVFIAQAYGSGSLGETMSDIVIEKPGVGATESFISIGAFGTRKEASNVANYIKTKFVRVLIGVLKVTPMANKPVWKYVPLQDFTSKSDIDWTKSVHEIDLQLYKKYGLSKEEKDFIETHVKEMV